MGLLWLCRFTKPRQVTIRLTQELVSQHAQLLVVEASLGYGGELPAQHLRQQAPGGLGRAQEERQILKEEREGQR